MEDWMKKELSLRLGHMKESRNTLDKKAKTLSKQISSIETCDHSELEANGQVGIITCKNCGFYWPI